MAKIYRLGLFLQKGKPPSSFYDHDIDNGPLRHKCVFCMKTLSRDNLRYEIDLFGEVPTRTKDRGSYLIERAISCTICINCEYAVRENDVDAPSDAYFYLEEYISEGKYPPNIVQFSLNNHANQICFLCRRDASKQEHIIHYLPIGYHRNELESNAVPGPLIICNQCEAEIESAKRNGEYKWIGKYALDICYNCGDQHFISRTEEDVRIGNASENDYLCLECALEKDLMGRSRFLLPTCMECKQSESNPKDILYKYNSRLREDSYICKKCGSTDKSMYVFYIDKMRRVEAYSFAPDKWQWGVIQIHSVDPTYDEVLHKSSKEFDNPYKALYAGALYYFFRNKQLTLEL